MEKNWITILFILIFLVGACSKDADTEQKVKIELSDSELYFTSEAAVQTVTTVGEDWTFGPNMIIDGENFLLDSDKTGGVIEIESGKLDNGREGIVKIVGEWFTIVRKNKTITISVLEARTHTTDKRKRTLSIDLKGDDCVETLAVIQMIQIAPGIVDDTIGLSIKDFIFNAVDSENELSTSGESWEFSNIYINGKCYGLDELEVEYSMLAQKYTAMKVVGPWFTVSRDTKKIKIILEGNNTSHERKLVIMLEDGDYWDYINIVQDVY